MKATEELKKEHRGIEVMLRVITAVAPMAGRGERVKVADLDGMMEFLTIFADKCHHGKEEEYLFPAMEEAGIRREGGPIGVMLAEHTKGRSCIARMKAAVGSYKAGDGAAITAFRDPALEYVSLLSGHIQKEDNVLFPMADAALASKDE